MTYEKIAHMAPINDVDEKKVNHIAENMKNNGFVGCPILIFNEQLFTGSHRLAALKKLEAEGLDVYDWDVAEDVTDIINDNFEKFETEQGWQKDIDYSNIGWLLKDSWVEQYKNEIGEW